MTNYALTIELIPQSTWGINVRSKVSQEEWDAIRKAVYKSYNHVCGICGSNKSLDAHEIWNFDNKTSQQTLIGIIALCKMCHHIKHIGYAGILARQGKLNYDKLIEHFCVVNQCTKDDFINHKNESFDIWTERSKTKWHVDISWLEQFKENLKNT